MLALWFLSSVALTPSKLYDLPVSNHGARVRLLLYKRGLEKQVAIVSPMELGGFLISNPGPVGVPRCLGYLPRTHQKPDCRRTSPQAG